MVLKGYLLQVESVSIVMFQLFTAIVVAFTVNPKPQT